MATQAVSQTELQIEMPLCAAFLKEPHRIKAMYGGRDSVKTWSMARQNILDAASRDLRLLCTREVQKTIKESVHLVLSDQVKLLGLEDYFDIQSNAIFGKRACNKGTRIVYTGLRSLCNDKTALKAYESYDRVWVEEAQTVSADSIRTLVPTMRKPGSEIWFSFNPDLETDPVIKFLFKDPPPGLKLVRTSYRDNLWLSDESRDYIEHLRRTNPKEYAHIYEGEFKTEVEGAIFGEELSATTQGGRERKVPYDPGKIVQTFWDIGDHYTAIWFVQVYPFEYHLIDYQMFELKGLADIFAELHRKPYNYGVHKMTQDATAPQLATGKTIEQQAMELAGRAAIHVLPIVSIKSQIAEARKIFPLCYFDADKCADGLNALRHYRFPDPGKSGVEHDKPLHDWASHGSSAFQTFAVGVTAETFAKPVHATPAYRPPPGGYGPQSWMG